MGFWSCATDETMPEAGVASGERVPITIEVSRGGDALTRTDLSEDLQNGGLTHTWAAGDEVMLYNAQGQESGKLTLQEGAGTSRGVFTGTVTKESGKYHLWYFGRPKVDAGASLADRYPYLDFSETGKVKLNFANQNFKSVDDLTAVDVLSHDVDIIVKGEKGYVEKSITMNPHVAMARFKVSGLPEGTTGTLKILNKSTSVISGGNKEYQIYYKHPMFLSGSGENAGDNSTTPDGFTYENVKNGSDIYVAFIPNGYELIFKLSTSDGKVYSHTFGNNSIQAGVYYQSFTEGENGNYGKSDGISIPLQPDNQEVKLVYHANFGNDEVYEDKVNIIDGITTLNVKNYSDTKMSNRDGENKYVCIGWSSTSDGKVNISSSITFNEGELVKDIYAVWSLQSNNPLNKWARYNLEYNKITGISSFAVSESNSGSLYQWGRNYGYSDYKDARGNLNQNGGYEYAAAGFSYYDSGLGLYSGSPNYYLYAGQIYNSSTVVGNIKNRFLINTKGTDYWIWSGGGNNWSSRAKAGGYSELCPEGWRIPNFDDFMEIFPEKTSGVNSISGDYVELKTLTKNNISYAIRWQLESNGLKIQAIVVPNDFDLDKYKFSLDWKCAVVVNDYTRLFGHTSTIIAHHETNNLPVVGKSYTAAPMPVGPNSGRTYSYKKGNTTYYYYKYDSILDFGKDMIGNYWMADKIGGFCFLDSSKHPNYGYTTSFNLNYLNAHDASAIRCVRNN